MKRWPQHGFSMIELMITIVILAILVVMGVPSFREWINNTQIRNAGESIQNGLRLARNEASQTGGNVEFYFPKAGTADWIVCSLSSTSNTPTTCSANVVQAFNASGGAAMVQVSNTTATASAKTYSVALTSASTGSIVFNSLGRPTAYGTSSILRIDVSGAAATSRRQVVTISNGGLIRMCDPAFTYAAASPQGCQ